MEWSPWDGFDMMKLGVKQRLEEKRWRGMKG